MSKQYSTLYPYKFKDPFFGAFLRVFWTPLRGSKMTKTCQNVLNQLKLLTCYIIGKRTSFPTYFTLSGFQTRSRIHFYTRIFRYFRPTYEVKKTRGKLFQTGKSFQKEISWEIKTVFDHTQWAIICSKSAKNTMKYF